MASNKIKEMITMTRFPDADQAGVTDDWKIESDDISGTLLGTGSSRQPQHSTGLTNDCKRGCPGGSVHHGDYVRTGHLCARCRWFEARVFRVDDSSDDYHYVISTLRCTILPDESPSHRIETAVSEFEVIEKLSGRRSSTGERWLSKPARWAVAQAAAFDDGMHDAYVDLFPDLAGEAA